MTELLLKAIKEVEKLPAEQQDGLAVRILTDLKGLHKRAAVQEDSLKGSVLHYNDPTEPVGLDDWEALR